MEKFRNFCINLSKDKIIIYILLLFFCLILACHSNNYDYDLYARLIVGETFVEKGIFNYQDFLSYTPTHIWYDHEWGSGVIFYLLLKYFGAYGLVLLHALTMFGTAFFVMKTWSIQKHAYPFSMTFMVLFLLLFSHLNPSIVRCHMFTFMFFAIFLYMLEKTRRFNSNILWFVPLIVLIWNNLHGGVVSGLGIIFIYMFCAFITGKPWRKYFYVLLVSTPVLAINPYGLEYLDFLLSANTKARNSITEWWPVFVERHALYYYPAFCTAVFTVLLAGINAVKKKADLTKLIVLFVTAALGIMHVKLLSITLIAIGALYYNDIMRLLDKNCIKIFERTIYPLLFLSLFYIPFTHPFVPKVSTVKFPVLEVEFITQNKIKGNLLTAFGLGSYTSYKLYPQNLIYMDGRYEEVYYDREFNRLLNFEHGPEKADWQDALTLYPTEILMPEKTSPVYSTLTDSPDWELIYEGNICGVFVKKGSKKNNYKLPESSKEYYEKTAFKNMGYFGKKSEN